jgi:transposase
MSSSSVSVSSTFRTCRRIEKILEDALLKISSVISDLMGASGRRFLAALVAGERHPDKLAALGGRRLKASTAQLEEALAGRFRDIHALEIGMLLELIDVNTMAAAKTDTYLGERYRRIARRRGRQKAIVAVSRTICEIAWMIII